MLRDLHAKGTWLNGEFRTISSLGRFAIHVPDHLLFEL
jgi:hypothetical protein